MQFEMELMVLRELIRLTEERLGVFIEHDVT